MVEVTFTLPVKTVNEKNSSEHWRYRQKRAKAHRASATWGLHCALRDGVIWRLQPPWVVTCTRLSSGVLDAHDGLPAALQHVVDGIADALGIPDNDPRVTWRYAQEKCKRGRYAVRVTVRGGP